MEWEKINMKYSSSVVREVGELFGKRVLETSARVGFGHFDELLGHISWAIDKSLAVHGDLSEKNERSRRKQRRERKKRASEEFLRAQVDPSQAHR